MRRLDIQPGQKFNWLTVIEELPQRDGIRMFSCVCVCGNKKILPIALLTRPSNISCGCYKAGLRTKHGMWESREYSTWENMIQRCTNPKSRKYNLYGGRGITVCDEWLKSFEAFYSDMGTRPPNTTLDRIDGDKGYYKGNCKWSNPLEQFVNVRCFTQKIKYLDINKSAEEWIAELNIDREIFKKRLLRGLSMKQALFLDVDIIVLNVVTRAATLQRLQQFLFETKFGFEKIVELIDCDHQEPYEDCLIRYLTGFNGWPQQYA